MDSEDALAVFQGKQIRRTWHDNQWHFLVVDIISVLADRPTPRPYRGNVKDWASQQLELSPGPGTTEIAVIRQQVLPQQIAQITKATP